LAAQDLGAGPGQRLIGGIEAAGRGGGVVHGHPQKNLIGEPGAPATHQVRADQPGLRGQGAGGDHAAGQGVEGGDGAREAAGDQVGVGGVTLGHQAAALHNGDPQVGKRSRQAGASGGAGLSECDFRGGVETDVAEQFGAGQGAEALFDPGASPGVRAATGVYGPGRHFGCGGGFAQSGGVAGPTRDFAPDHRGVQPGLRGVLCADPTGGDIRRAPFLTQQFERDELHEGRIAAADTRARNSTGAVAQQALQLPTKLKHRIPPAYHPSRHETGRRTFEGTQQSRSRRV
jgi:hypothetical protein